MSLTEETTTVIYTHTPNLESTRDMPKTTEDDISEEEMLLKCIHFDQDCFYDVRMLAADRRQTDWSSEYLPELSSVPKDAYVQSLKDSEKYDVFFERGNIGKLSKFDHEVLSNIHVESVVVLGSTQDGLYLEKGFPIFDKGPSVINETDVDIVFEYGGIEILQNCKPNTDVVHLCLTNTMHAGYFKLRICSPLMNAKQHVYFKHKHLKLKLFGDLDCSRFYVVRNSLNEVYNSASIAGNTEDELGIHEIDNVAAFKMKEWPKIASAFISRERQSGWPPEELIMAVTANGCGFVPKGIAKSKDKDYQWRISFAASEKTLVRSLTLSQIRAYLFFKSIFKLKLSEPEGLSSYMMKNILFWTMETIDQSSWREDNILFCVEALVDMLCACLENRLITSYFLPSLNLISDLDKDTLFSLRNTAREIQRDTFTSIIKCTDSPDFKGSCEVSVPMLMSAFSSDEEEINSVCSMVYFTMYLHLRLEVLRYQIRLSPQTLKKSFETNCRSMLSVVAPRAVRYLLESITLQPDISLYSLNASPDGTLDLNIKGMRTKVVEFWKRPFYKGLFNKVIKDQGFIHNETFAVIPEFSEFIDWVDLTCLWDGGVAMNKDNISFPPNLD